MFVCVREKERKRGRESILSENSDDRGRIVGTARSNADHYEQSLREAPCALREGAGERERKRGREGGREYVCERERKRERKSGRESILSENSDS